MVDGFVRWVEKGDVGLNQQAKVDEIRAQELTVPSATDRLGMLIEQLRTQDHSELRISGRGDSADLLVRDHAALRAAGLILAVAQLRAKDHAQADVHTSERLDLSRDKHAQVVTAGSAEVFSDSSVGAIR